MTRTDGSTRDRLVVFSDGGSRGNPGPAAIGAVVLDPSMDPPETLASISECIGIATNNVAEYKALIAGLESAARIGSRAISVRADSELIVRQLEGRYRVKHPALQPLFQEVKTLLATWESVDVAHVRREANTVADALVNAALDGA